MLLANGDVTKRETIWWTTTLQDAEPYARRQIERRSVDLAILGLLGVSLPGPTPEPMPRKHGALGAACGHKLIPLCQPIYGEKLSTACRSCPGPR